MAFGLSNKEIAQRLQVGRRTVESHIDHVLGKLNAPTRTRAVVEAGRAGLLNRLHGSAVADRRLHNLPSQVTPLFGREQDRVGAKQLLESGRLLTLSGSGGVGKTRLALAVAFDLLGAYRDGVWFCDFAPISDPQLAISLVANVLNVKQLRAGSDGEAVVSALSRRQLLLVLDNCEHILDAAAKFAQEILRGCQEIRILATSRQPLGIPGEVVQRVRSLATPDSSVGLPAENALQFGAVALFVDRAQAAETGFRLTDQNASVVTEICQRLDGIPLAIELAATRVRVVSLDSLATSLEDRFRVLTVGSRGSMPRHRTLSALIDWSYDLLPLSEQALFVRLGTFAGSFTLEAATEICQGDEIKADDMLDLMSALVDKSLVVVHAGAPQNRYRLLESTRAYGLEIMRTTGERELFARRHAEYFYHQAERADKGFGIGSTTAWLSQSEPDIENYRAALEWALTGGHDIVLGSAIAGNLERLWALSGLAAEGRRWLGAALERLDDQKYPAVAARVWRAKARFVQGQPMRDCTERALTLYGSVGDGLGAAHTLRSMAFSLLQMGRLDEANEVIDRAITAMREHGDRVGVASCLSLLGVSAYNHGDYAKGRDFYYQALVAYKSLGDETATANVLGNLAELEFADGHPDRALESVSESLAITSQGKEQSELAIDRNNSAAYLIALGRYEEATRFARASLQCAHSDRNPWNTAVALQHCALLAALSADTSTAAKLLGYVNAQFKSLELERETTEQWGYEALMKTLRHRIQEPELQRLAHFGATWTEDEAVGIALGIGTGAPDGAVIKTS